MSITAHLLTPAAFSVSLALTRLRFFDSLTDEEDPGYVQDRPVAMEEFFSGGGGGDLLKTLTIWEKHQFLLFTFGKNTYFTKFPLRLRAWCKICQITTVFLGLTINPAAAFRCNVLAHYIITVLSILPRCHIVITKSKLT